MHRCAARVSSGWRCRKRFAWQRGTRGRQSLHPWCQWHAQFHVAECPLGGTCHGWRTPTNNQQTVRRMKWPRGNSHPDVQRIVVYIGRVWGSIQTHHGLTAAGVGPLV